MAGENEDILGNEDVDAPVEVSDKPREPTAYEKRLRTENAKYRTRAIEAEKRIKEAEEKIASEVARVSTELSSKADQRLIRAELKAEAIKNGLVDLDGLKLLDTSGVKLDEHGDVVIPQGFWDAAKKAKAYLFAPQTGAAAGTTSSTQSAPKPTPSGVKMARDMTPEEYAKMKASLTRG